MIFGHSYFLPAFPCIHSRQRPTHILLENEIAPTLSFLHTQSLRAGDRPSRAIGLDIDGGADSALQLAAVTLPAGRGRMTNAKRLKLGLPLLPPTQRSEGK